ncbi:hypothetical protein RJ640_002298 [Escallonia rubra]|uniref:Uncharacterized protein n=1 Tax=Escallonia rubra TaxID=112253 RepID=A0AA88UN29_9ASTE|nr:hypothetical protein RJ640_002298 [Escallonia rubra]
MNPINTIFVAQLASGLAQRLDPFSPEADGVSPQGVTSGSNPSFVIGDPMKKDLDFQTSILYQFILINGIIAFEGKGTVKQVQGAKT